MAGAVVMHEGRFARSGPGRDWALRYGLRLAVLAAALALWQALSEAGVIRGDEFPSMTATVSALGRQAASATLVGRGA